MENLQKKKELLKSKMLPVVGGVVGSLGFALPCFAAEPASFVVTTEMAAPLFSGITTSITNLLPLGLGVLAMMVGIGIIPRIVYKFM